MIKKLITIALIFFNTIGLFAQINTKNISFKLRYPLPIGNNFINKGFFGDGYTGLIDLGIEYNVIQFKEFGLGIVFNTSILRVSSIADVTLLVLSPQIKFDYNFNLNSISIIPQVGFGYSNWRFYSIINMTNEIGEPMGTTSEKTNSDGLTFHSSTKLLFNSSKKINWYFQISYEFSKLEKPKLGSGDTKFNRNIHLLYPGIGIIWNFNNK